MNEQRFSHYRIVRELGAGKMGVVYLARDEHLHCDVAVKVLPSGTLANEDSRRRFRQEALAIAKRAHRNIVAVRDFDTQGGIDYLVMEKVEGEGLDQMLKKGPLPEERILDLGAQLASGLAAAHGAGVVHRDIKPGNLKVTPDGDLKILDFGLAKFRATEGESTVEISSITQTGHIVGTLAYLAPEVLLGKPADERSDIYSAGVVLYEMASGRRPHAASDPSAFLQQVLSEQPRPPTQWNHRISPDLERVILKATDKDPSRRYQSAGELEIDLKRADTRTGSAKSAGPAPRVRLVLVIAAVLVTAAVIAWPKVRDLLFPPPATASLAVLPLRSSSGDSTQDYFADGMTDELITTLSGISSLKVISRTSAMSFKGSPKSLPEIARQLHVRWIVEGSVVRTNSTVRINASLVDASQDKNLWARRYEGSINDVLSLQADVARAITRDVNVALTASERDRLRRRTPVVPEAMEAYLQGNFYWNQRKVPELRRAIQYFEDAISRDPRFARPHAGLADVYGYLGNFNVLPQDEAYGMAKASALRALELEPDLGEAHASVAVVKLEYEWDWLGAEREFQRAIELNPGNATAHQWYADYLARMGRLREARTQIARALEMDPFSPSIRGMMGTVCYYARDYHKAVENYRAAIKMNPEEILTRFYLALAYLARDSIPDAIAELEGADRHTNGYPLIRAGLGYAYALAGRRHEALRIYEDLSSRREGPRVARSLLALVAIGLGDRDLAFRHLEEGFAERESYLGHLKVAPLVDSLRGDPRLADLMRRLRLS